MTSPGGNEVGRVSVRVLPDTSGFRKEAKAKLEKETEGLELELPVTIDSTGLRQKLKAVAAEASRGVDAEIGVDVNHAELRQFEKQMQQSIDKSTQSIRRNGGGGGNFITKALGNIPELLKQIAKDFVAVTTGVKSTDKAIWDLGKTTQKASNSARRVQTQFREVSRTVSETRTNLTEVSKAVAKVEESSKNLPVLWSEAQKSMQQVSKEVLDAADNAKTLQVAPSLDPTAMQKFRTDLKKAFDNVRKDVNTHALFEVGPEGIRSVATFEAAARKAVNQVRQIASAIRDDVTQATSRLKFAWDGLTSTVRGIPGWIKAIGNSISSEVEDKWDRFTVAVNRTGIEIRDIPQRVSAIGDAIQTGLIRGWLDFDNAANSAITRVSQGIDRLSTGFNRSNLEIENGARRISTAWDAVGTALNRVNLETESGARRLASTWTSVTDGIATAFNRVNLESQNGLQNLTNMVGSWNSVGAAVDDVAKRAYEFARNLADADNRTRLVQNVTYDLQRAWATVSLGVDEAGNRMQALSGHADRIRSGFTSLASTIKGLDWDAPNRAFMQAGNQGVRFGTVVRNIGTATKEVFQAVGTLGSAGFNAVSTAASNVASTVKSGLGSAVSSINESFSKMGEGAKNRLQALVNLVQSILQLGAAIGQLGAVSFVLVAAGAAVTAAWGLASAAIAAIPGLIAAAALPIAAVMLGMDGIKKAAEAARPAFDKLKTTISDTFQARLTPVFRDLAKAIPDITTDMIGLTNAISLVASDLTKFLTGADAIKLINTSLKNANEALVVMSPGITKIVDGFLKITAQVAPFQLLTSAINTFADAWTTSVNKTLADGTFQNAVQRLSDILNVLLVAIVALVEDGLTILANAGPGITSFFQSLTDFFGKFDWVTLGKAVGDVFQGLADALDRVPQGTIDAIAAGFQKLGDTFRDAQFQQQLANIADAIPAVLDALNLLIRGFGFIASAISGTIVTFQGFVDTLGGLALYASTAFKAITDPGGNYDEAFAKANAAIAAGGAKVKLGLDNVFSVVQGSGPQLASAATASVGALTGALQSGFTGIQAAGEKFGIDLGLKITDPLKQVAPQAGQALSTLPGAVNTAITPVAGAVDKGLQPVPDNARAIFDQIAPTMESAFQSLGNVATTGMGNIERGVGDGLIRVRDLFTRGFDTLAPLVTTSFDKVKVGVETTMTGLVTSVTTGLTALTTSFTGMGTVFATFGTQLTQAATSATTFTANMTTVNTSVTTANTSLTTLNTTLTTTGTNLTTLNTGFTTFNTTLTTLGTALTTVVTNLTTLNVNVTGLVTLFNGLNAVLTLTITSLTGLGVTLVALNIAFPLLITNLTNLNTILTTLNATLALFVTAINNVVIAINLLIPAITSLITALTNLGLAFTTLEATINTTMVNITSIIVNALALILQAFISAFAEITAAVQTGMQDATTAVQQGCDDMVTALNDAVPRFREAGSNMGAALAEGLRSQLGAVQAAAAELANAAAAATAAAAGIASPSKVFIKLGNFLGLGFAKGMEKSRRHIRNTAKRIVHDVEQYGKAAAAAWAPDGWMRNFPQEASGAAREISRTSINEWRDHTEHDDYGWKHELIDAITGWNVNIDQNGVAKMVNKSNTRRNRRG